ncbi:MAG: phytoene/squalene synthase family protein, partial [Pseudomonadota bacterium]
FEQISESYLSRKPEALFAEHGKSFYFASMVFRKERLVKISLLYRLCRFVDDCADELPEKESDRAVAEILKDLDDPSRDTRVNELVSQVEQWGVGRDFVRELVIGAQFDAKGGEIRTTQDLMIYCYRVAGVVGLMMCPLIGVQSKQAYPHAIDLGIGMQLTNICRDILEDARKGRAYLPTEMLTKARLAPSDLEKPVTPDALKALVKSYLNEADRYYSSAYEGLAFIPFRPRFVILLAGEVYRHIGVKIRRNGYDVLSGRTYLSMTEKFVVAFKTVFKMATPKFWVSRAHVASLHVPIQSLPGANR